jgi:hypothetical protein
MSSTATSVWCARGAANKGNQEHDQTFVVHDVAQVMPNDGNGIAVHPILCKTIYVPYLALLEWIVGSFGRGQQIKHAWHVHHSQGDTKKKKKNWPKRSSLRELCQGSSARVGHAIVPISEERVMLLEND